MSAEIDATLQFDHQTLAELRRVEGHLQILSPIFHSTMQIIKVLDTYNKDLEISGGKFSEECLFLSETLNNYLTLYEDYTQNAAFLLERVRTTAQLLADTLGLKHQVTAQQISENTLDLTHSATYDSAKIRVITVVTLTYLPATFVAVRSWSYLLLISA